MLVRMKVAIGGYRNGEAWPPPGTVVELPDSEAQDLVVAGYAEEANDDPQATPAVDDPTPPTGDGDPTISGPEGEGPGADHGPPAPEVTPEAPARARRARKAAKKPNG